MKAAQFCFLNILPLDEYFAHRALNIQTGLINPGLTLKASRSEVKLASYMKHDFVSLGHSAGIVTSGQQAQEQSENCVWNDVQGHEAGR
jgi:hypothetical protein